MKFHELLNSYISQIGCTAKELSEITGLSAAAISRYRSGQRIPQPYSEQLTILSDGLSKLSGSISSDEIMEALNESLNVDLSSFETLQKNFDQIITLLGINMKSLATALNYDISFLYRVRSGQRRPQNIEVFANNVCSYIIKSYVADNDYRELASLTGANILEIDSPVKCHQFLYHYLTENTIENQSEIKSFLNKMDDFDLQEYIRSIHFDKLKPPTAPLSLPKTKNYYGIKQMREGELDFFKTTVLSKAHEPIFMCSDMPISDMAEDMEFNKKWMFGIAMSLKKGLRLNMVHNIDRPWNELMLGLEAWIPIYMTGQVMPYYMAHPSNSTYYHLLYTSGAAALSGECISGSHNNGKYYLTNNRKELDYYQKRSKDLLNKASPLMEIFDHTRADDFLTFLNSENDKKHKYRNILSVPPLYTISEELLSEILQDNNISDADSKKIREFHKYSRENFLQYLTKCPYHDSISEINDDVMINLSEFFIDVKLKYKKEQFQRHLQETVSYADKYENYTVSTMPPLFNNINIHIIKGEYVIISKQRAPVIQFVIRHPKLIAALESFEVIARD